MICIADVHLRPGFREDSLRFISWLEQSRQDGQDIYVLGDLFDYWFTGAEKAFRDVLESLQSPGVFIIPGNRDFLLTNRSVPGLTVLGEEEIVLAPTFRKVLLAHGHTLTSDDYGFKVLHALGWPVLRVLDRLLKGPFKDSFARFLVSSSSAVRPPRAAIDPNLAEKRKVDMIICGHLHRLHLSERLIVLPSFFDSGQWLVWDDDGYRMASGK